MLTLINSNKIIGNVSMTFPKNMKILLKALMVNSKLAWLINKT
jgi:hypothetical protein